jgi:hypothetical protein
MMMSDDQRRPAVLQIPPADAHGTRRNVDCEVEEMHGKHLILSTTERVPESTAVSIECEDTLLLGEVVICTAQHGIWQLEIRVEQMLTGLQSLMALRAQLLSDSLSAPLPLLPVGMRN